MKKYLSLLLTVSFMLTSFISAEVRFDPIFTESMVIQQGMPIKIFGTESVTNSKLKISFGGKSVNVVPDKNGYWEAVFKPMKGGFGKYTIRSEVKYKKEKIYREVKNVYVGDVWLCAGSGNMDAPISKYPAIKSKLLEVENHGLKFTAIRKYLSATPKNTIEHDYATKKKWQPCKFGDALWGFSTLAYFFGDKISYKTKYPIGLVEVTQNAPIEAWIPKEEYTAAGYNERIIKNKNGSISPKSSSVVYNGVVHPLTKMNFKGVLWSHGHDSALEPIEYQKQLKTMVSSWRKRFNNPELPFFVAQTAPHKGNSIDKSGESLAWLRESQSKILSVPNTGLVVLTDAGEYTDTVTQEQQKAGERFALWAQKMNRKSTPAMGPTLKKVTPGNGSIIVEFNNVGRGLKTSKVALNKVSGKTPGTDPAAAIAEEKEIKGFQIAGKDGVFQPATAKIAGSRIQLLSRSVRRPIYVRYAWTNFPLANVFNSYDLPMVPFRTDRLPPPNFDGSFPTSAVDLITATGEQMKLKINKDFKTQSESIGEGRGTLISKIKKDISALFSIDSAEFQKGKSPKTNVTVVFFDKDPGYLTISYDSSEKSDKGSKHPEKYYKLAGKIKMSGTKTWKYAKFSVEDAFFGKRLSGADLKVATTNSDIILSGVFLDKAQ